MDALAALRLQIEWGADEALDERPIDRMGAKPVAIPAVARTAPVPSRIGAVALAEEAAAGANTLEALYRTMEGFRDCGLAMTATKLAFADGNPEAGLVLVGEAPGAEEDLAGRPFVGPAGQLLDRMLASIGLSRSQALLTNLVPWRPPGGRAPTEAELQICAPFLWRHLTLLRPRVIVALGQSAARVLTGRDDTMRKLRGRWYTVTVPGLPAPISMMAMLHPATLLRGSAGKKDAWTDLVALRRHLDANS
jgi:DNA polymerase